MARLEGKVAIVTGASRGIGAQIARQFAREGAKEVITHRNSAESAEQVAEEIRREGGQALVIRADVGDAGDAQLAIDRTVAEFGVLDILVNNAGVFGGAPLEATPAEEIERQFRTNVFGLLLMTKAALPHLREGGRIINIGSVVTSRPPAGTTVYSGTKAAVDAISVALAQEVGARGITVNTVAPGFTETEMTQDADKGFRSYALSRTPLGRFGHPDDIAQAVTFLASDEGRWITAETLNVGGGVLL